MLVKYRYSLFESDTYCIYIYDNLDNKSSVTCVGNNLPKTKIQYEFETEEVKHPKYGTQYKVLSFREHIGTGRNNIVVYLSSGLIKGIGKVLAERIYDTFKDDALKILETNPLEYLRVKGISKSKLDKITASYEQNHIPNEVIDFFKPYSINIADVFTFYKVYKKISLKKLMKTPLFCVNLRASPLRMWILYVLI